MSGSRKGCKRQFETLCQETLDAGGDLEICRTMLYYALKAVEQCRAYPYERGEALRRIAALTRVLIANNPDPHESRRYETFLENFPPKDLMLKEAWLVCTFNYTRDAWIDVNRPAFWHVNMNGTPFPMSGSANSMLSIMEEETTRKRRKRRQKHGTIAVKHAAAAEERAAPKRE